MHYAVSHRMQVVRQHRAAAQEQRHLHRGMPARTMVVSEVFRPRLRRISLRDDAAAAKHRASTEARRPAKQPAQRQQPSCQSRVRHQVRMWSLLRATPDVAVMRCTASDHTSAAPA